ncbi:6-phosphofructokinase [Candidatus Saganbacteria bacterium]|nr:6-phosphofructokinase [Candidatus Saganbacteria bacterium]
MKNIAVVTPGGDAPGMNVAIRAVVRYAIYHGLDVYGIQRGWQGLIEGNIISLDLKSVGGIINRGGTILHTHRSSGFRKRSLRKTAYQNLKAFNIDAMVVIGGDGSLKASYEFYKEYNFPIINVPASIDNDIYGTDYSIGFDTAVNTAVEAIDKIRDTATSHERAFIIEVMGRNNGFIALDVGMTAGAEAILIPEIKYDLAAIAKRLLLGQQRGKTSFIIVVAEGAGHAPDIAKLIQKKTKLDVRVSILGHMQRGGSPTALSREAACKLGSKAVELLLQGKKAMMVGIISDKVVSHSAKEIIAKKKKIDIEAYKLAEILSS